MDALHLTATSTVRYNLFHYIAILEKTMTTSIHEYAMNLDHDMGAPPGVVTSDEIVFVLSEEEPSRSSVDKSIVITTVVYIVLIIVLFVGARVAGKTGDGWDGFVRALAVLFIVGGGALVVAVVNLVASLAPMVALVDSVQDVWVGSYNTVRDNRGGGCYSHVDDTD